MVVVVVVVVVTWVWPCVVATPHKHACCGQRGDGQQDERGLMEGEEVPPVEEVGFLLVLQRRGAAWSMFRYVVQMCSE